jgi:hypothetical protein
VRAGNRFPAFLIGAKVLVSTMNNKKNLPADDPLAGIRGKIGELAGKITEIEGKLNKKSKSSVWTLAYWEKHKAKLTIIILLLSLTWYVFGLVLDSHIGSSIHPLQVQDNKLDGDIQRLTGIVTGLQSQMNTLQAQVATQKYSTIAPKELKTHSEELSRLRSALIQIPATTATVPQYWPTVFQLINLNSKAITDLEKIAGKGEGSLDNVGSNPPGGMSPIENGRVVLKNLIQGMTFKNCIVRFDPSVRLVNDIFINCVFIFPSSENPPKPLQEIGKTLLASDLSNVTLNAS